MKTRRIFAVGESLVSSSSPVQFLISQNSGKDKPPSIDATNAPNEHGRARDAATVATPDIQRWRLYAQKSI
jgi:hypothetical protein